MGGEPDRDRGNPSRIRMMFGVRITPFDRSAEQVRARAKARSLALAPAPLGIPRSRPRESIARPTPNRGVCGCRGGAGLLPACGPPLRC